MQKQRVCIIGGGLSGLTTAIVLGKLNLSIDLFASNFFHNYTGQKSTAISQSNYNYLKKLNIFSTADDELWPCKEIKLYGVNKDHESKKIFDFNKNNILHMTPNKKIISIMKKEIKQNKKIKIKFKHEVKKIFSDNSLVYLKTENKKIYKYNLIILCTGRNSFLTKKFLGVNYFNYPYNETSIVTTIKHDHLKNNIARQFFLEEGPLAILPLSNQKTSVIWSVKNIKFNNRVSNKKFLVEKKIRNTLNNIYKNIKFSSSFEYNDLNFHFGHKCYNDRVLIFGEASHSIHPFAGQGFNMIVRDLKKLENVIKKEIKLGLDIGCSTGLDEFTDETKPNNLIYSIGVDVMKKMFENNTLPIKTLRNYYISRLNNNKTAKNFFLQLADDGINI